MGVVIPFRRPIPPKKEEPYYSDLDEMLAITNKLAYPSIIMLLTGHWLYILHDKNHGDVEASLDDVKGFRAEPSMEDPAIPIEAVTRGCRAV